MIDEDNELLLSTNGDMIYIICNTDEQQRMVVKRMTTDNCMLEEYEVWEEDGEHPQTTILKFRVLDYYEQRPQLN
jgi:hypothetical protein|tara:strand:- start:241 stop:465 length:225 start_codon:yes stop_codon:yes gene_type:complete